jgi:hypothetical protein
MQSTSSLWLAAAFVVLVAPHPIIAGQAPSTSPAGTWTPNASPLRTSPPKSPYRTLFGGQRARVSEARVAEALREATAARTGKQPAVVCGMTIFPADPSVDPKMLMTPPPSDTRHTIRSIPPPVCR